MNSRQISNPLRSPHRRKQAGMTMPEIMLGLALIAIVTASGIVAYNEVAPRVAANRIMAGINGFVVDVTQYLTEYHSDQPGNTPESTAAGTIEKDWMGMADIPELTIACAALSDHPNCTVIGTAIMVANPNLLRFANMPSLRFGEGAYDEDGDAEWHIPISVNEALELQFSIVPDNQPFGQAIAEWAVCETHNLTTRPDTAVAVQIAIESRAICDNLAQGFARYDAVQQAYCLDDESTPPLATAIPADKGGDVALNVCFNVLR